MNGSNDGMRFGDALRLPLEELREAEAQKPQAAFAGHLDLPGHDRLGWWQDDPTGWITSYSSQPTVST